VGSVKALFDTNILIDYLAGIEAADTELGRYRDRLISEITWMEVLVGARTDEEADVVEMFLRDFKVVDVTRRVAREAVTLRRARRLRLPDAIIWATAQVESALLVTRNTRDFPQDEPGIRVPY
jgi:predicted nucleic acid-binding protein